MDSLLTSFQPEATHAVLVRACRHLGISSDDSRLIRHQTNAVYVLPHAKAVAKVARPGANLRRVQQGVALANWLAAARIPTVSPYPDAPEPLTIDGHCITLWTFEPEQPQPVSTANLAAPLQQLHQLQNPPPIELPQLNPFRAIRRSIRAAPLASELETLLSDRCDALEAQYVDLRFSADHQLIHGDAHHRNALQTNRGTILCDWESAAVGPVEWDLTTVAVHATRFGYGPADHSDFSARYGRDITVWPGYSTMRQVRELRMITTNAWKSPPGSRAAEEVLRRIKALGHDDGRDQWTFL